MVSRPLRLGFALAALGAGVVLACDAPVGADAVTQTRDGTFARPGTPSCTFADKLAPDLAVTEPTDVRGLEAHCFGETMGLMTLRSSAATYERSSLSLARTFPRSPDRAYAIDYSTGVVTFVDLAGPRPAFVRLSSTGDEIRRVPVELPHVRGLSPSDEWTFRDLCQNRDELLLIPDVAAPFHLDLVLLGDESAVLVVETCGYVDALQFSTRTGGAASRTSIAERTPVFALPISTFVDVSGGAATIVTTTPGDDDRSPKKITYWRTSDPAPPQRFSLPTASVHPFAFRDCGDFALLVGSEKRDALLGPNDTSTDDAWVAKIDLARGVVLKSRAIDIENDDYAFAAACDRDSGDIFVGGTTGRHFVDTGSWDGGGKAMVLRLDMDLAERDRIVFGNERLAIAQDLQLGEGQIVVTGLWDGMPNNHLPSSESWSRAFFAVLPRTGFSNVALSPRSFRAIGEVVSAAH